MKKILLILSLFTAINIAAQEPFEADSSMYRTVKDTSYLSDQRLEFMTNTILPAIADFMQNYIRQAKVEGMDIKYSAETKQLMNKIERAVTDYSINFRQIKDIKVNKDDIIKEYGELNKRINTITSDPDAKYLQVMQEFTRIKNRQAKLSSLFNQVK